MSDIYGTGWGSDHDWKRGSTNEAFSRGTKATHYKCMNCGLPFSHYYDNVPNIFEDLKRSGVPEHCENLPDEPPTPARASTK